MAIAEQGGNQPQRVYLVGGPKHGEYINLPIGHSSYEFTSMQTLMSPPVGLHKWPENATHVYKLDQTLTNEFNARPRTIISGHVSLFTHEVLWGSPYQGGFNLLALTDALRTIEDQKVAAETALQTQNNLMDSLKKEVEAHGDEKALNIEWQEKYEKLLAEIADKDERFQLIRNYLELAALPLYNAQQATGRKYRSPLDDVD